MQPLLRNPVYHSLLGNDAHLGSGAGKVKWFDEGVSPFAGFAVDNKDGFDELHAALPAGRKILYATPHRIETPAGWQTVAFIEGLQFLFEHTSIETDLSFDPTPLGPRHVDEMVALATLTKPGPFAQRTIEFGHYYGVFENGRLAAMTGQRLHIENFSEISAVCTHPNCLGKGYATALMRHQTALILSQGKIPFLHVRADNHRAIAVYERLGFINQGVMNFYVLKHQ